MSMTQGRDEQKGNNEKEEIQQETSEEGLVLKELPSHLKYIYLEPPQRKPVIISARLSDSCHGRVSGINKICIRSSFYCRIQATAA